MKNNCFSKKKLPPPHFFNISKIHTKFKQHSIKYRNVFLSYSAKTKRDGQTDGWRDGRAVFQYLPSWAFDAAGDIN